MGVIVSHAEQGRRFSGAWAATFSGAAVVWGVGGGVLWGVGALARGRRRRAVVLWQLSALWQVAALFGR
jgi:hypothetical protein